MRVVIKNGEVIKTFGTWKQLGRSYEYGGLRYTNLKKLSVEQLEAIDIYTVNFPKYDRTLEKESHVEYDFDKDECWMVIVNKDLPTIEEAKVQAISKIKLDLRVLLNNTGWALERKTDIGKEVPEQIKVERLYGRNACDKAEEEINSLETIKEVLEYKTRLTNLELDELV